MPINYKKIIIAAVKIVWKNKYLWFFGLFVAFLSGNGGLLSWETDKSELVSGWQRLQSTQIFDLGTLKGIVSLAGQDPVGVSVNLLILAITLILAIFIAWLAFVSQGALINNVAKYIGGQKTDFKEGLKTGKRHFWPVFFFKITEKIVGLALLAILALPFIISFTISYGIWGAVFFSATILILVFLLFIIFFVIRYSMSYSVIKNRRFIDALKDGWTLFYKNLIINIETGVVIFSVGIVLGLIFFVGLYAAAIPFLFLSFALGALSVGLVVKIISVVSFVVLFAYIVLAGAILAAFGDSFLTIFFLELIKGKRRSWLSKLFSKKL